MKELKMEPGETLDVFMERSGRLLDMIMHHPERMKEDPVLSQLSEHQKKELDNEICRAMEPEINLLAREIAGMLSAGADREDCYDTARSHLWLTVYEELYKYNNPEYLKGRFGCRFRRFVRNYRKDTINKVLSENTGLSPNTVKYMNRIRNARKSVAWEQEVDEDRISPEQIHAELIRRGFDEPSLPIIRDLMPHLKNNVAIDEVEESQFRMEEKGYAVVEKAFFEEDLEAILSKLSPLQALFFLKHKMAENSHGDLDLLASDSKIITLCKTDETYGRQYEAIMKLEDEKAVRKGLHTLMKKINDSAASLFRKHAKERGLEPDDLMDMVGDWAVKKLAEYE